MADQATQENVVDLLLAQHEEIRHLASTVEKNHGKVRKDAFDRLRRLLAVHETAEEEVVHPFARRATGDGSRVVDARLEEENKAKGVLSDLEKMDPESADFEGTFARFHRDLEAHASHEEEEEFPRIAREATPEQMRGMAKAVRAAEAIAPTHPHQGTESPTKNLALGPMAAVADRVRDAIGKARG
ncbi:hemerythrin domain-containing protein [Actinomadura mexicana]|uniref:Hemerythrin HHE cation binding domain-containing protein n=1 Tax=Actinomadura mexicana TaxID=134959 RepID=A0A238VQR1_9ACTN|nr:hemerythrin domain-containing protein [Actinomadura mexicana]SNR36700.1 Hemerythrin HHE cation binding domain-containing protein [Actinomadura mexicana]